MGNLCGAKLEPTIGSWYGRLTDGQVNDLWIAAGAGFFRGAWVMSEVLLMAYDLGC